MKRPKDIIFTISAAVSGFDQSRIGWDRICEICVQCGYGGMEGAPPLFRGMNEGALSRVAGIFNRSNLTIPSFHLPYKDERLHDLASLYETDRRRAVDVMLQWLETAHTLGSTLAIVHPTTLKGYSVDVEGLDALMSSLVRSLEEILPRAEALGITVAVENTLPSGGGRLGSRPEHLQTLAESVNHPHFGFCLDTGHALVAAGSAGPSAFGDMLTAMRPRLKAFHLSDTGGDRDSHLAPGRGLVNWSLVAPLVKEVRGAVCIETPPFAPGPDYSTADWSKLLEDTRRLLGM